MGFSYFDTGALVASSDRNSSSTPNTSNTSDAQKTEVVYGEQKTTELSAQLAYNAEQRIDCCLDSIGVARATQVPQFIQAIQYAKSRRVRLRYITEVSNQNISHCKTLAKLVELRHLEKIIANFAMNESESISTAMIMEESSIVPSIYSNIVEIVQQQQFFLKPCGKKRYPLNRKSKKLKRGSN